MRLESLAFASPKSQFPIGEGGGETVIRDLLHSLHTQGLPVEVMGTYLPPQLPHLKESLESLGVPLEVCPESARCSYRIDYTSRLSTPDRFDSLLEERLTTKQHDALLIQGVNSWSAVEAARRHGILPVFWSHNGLELDTFAEANSLPLVLVNSQFFLEKLQEKYHMPMELLYPAVDLDKYRIEANSHRYITMINPVVMKGVAYLLKLALAHRDREFLVVEGWGTPPDLLSIIQRIPNVTWLDRQLDMREVYNQTHILVVPSRWEAFGRVITEAQVNGIPVLASRVGGIPEALGDGGVLVDEISNPDAWQQGLAEVEARYDELSERARSNAENFSKQRAAQRLLEIFDAFPG